MKKIKTALCVALLTLSCPRIANPKLILQRLTIAASVFAKGADVGWLAQMEATGYAFHDVDGSQKDCLQLLKDRGINTFASGFGSNLQMIESSHCSKEETVAMALFFGNLFGLHHLSC